MAKDYQNMTEGQKHVIIRLYTGTELNKLSRKMSQARFHLAIYMHLYTVCASIRYGKDRLYYMNALSLV